MKTRHLFSSHYLYIGNKKAPDQVQMNKAISEQYQSIYGIIRKNNDSP